MSRWKCEIFRPPLHRRCTNEIEGRSRRGQDEPTQDSPIHRQMSHIRHTLIARLDASCIPWVGWPRADNRASC